MRWSVVAGIALSLAVVFNVSRLAARGLSTGALVDTAFGIALSFVFWFLVLTPIVWIFSRLTRRRA